jgi:hypothetical protein
MEIGDILYVKHHYGPPCLVVVINCNLITSVHLQVKSLSALKYFPIYLI